MEVNRKDGKVHRAILSDKGDCILADVSWDKDHVSKKTGQQGSWKIHSIGRKSDMSDNHKGEYLLWQADLEWEDSDD